MAYFLFVDESGGDNESPYEVLAGVAIEDRDLWNLVQALQETEVKHFGTRYTRGDGELKAKKLLKRKVFRLAQQLEQFDAVERSNLARMCLENGAGAGKQQLTALAQAKLLYVHDALDLCIQYRCKAFASIVHKKSPAPPSGQLRKDYAYLFERFFYYIEDHDPKSSGIVVFDEREKSQSHILVDQMSRYFRETAKGRSRARQIIPEPFFVHSDLTTGVQLADLCAYIISWGLRFRGMDEPVREELRGYAGQVAEMRYVTRREVDTNPDFVVWGFALINDLRPRDLK